MVRKTKADTEQTRSQILAAARQVFAERGVSRTTLEQIAKQAGVTRGAIYWHFRDKPELFFAMREQASLPLIDRVDEALPDAELQDPLKSIQTSMLAIIKILETDAMTRTTLEIVSFKCEYVDEFKSVNKQAMKAACNFKDRISAAYKRAHRKGHLRAGISDSMAALESFTFMKGLIQLWLADTEGDFIRKKAAALIRAHIATRRK